MAFYVRFVDNEIVSLLSLTVDGTLLSFKTETDRKYFENFMNESFEMTSPGKQTIMSFLSTRIVQSEHGISLDQTYHIKNKILNDWFPPNSTVKHVNTPIDHTTDFEIKLGTTAAIKQHDLHTYEKLYHGEFRHSIGQLLHVQQWTRADISYSVSRLATYNTSPNPVAFKTIRRIMQFLHTHPHQPLFYPRRKLGTSETINYQWSPKESSSYTLPSLPVVFSDAAFANITPDRRSMEAHVFLLNGVAYAWSSNVQRATAKDSTDAEIRSAFKTANAIVCHKNFLTSSSITCLLRKPMTLFLDSTATKKVIQANKVTSRTRHLDVPVNYTHEIYNNGYFQPEYVHRSLNLADALTKALPAQSFSRHWDIMRGLRFYPSKDTPHGKYLRDLTFSAITDFDETK